MTMRKPFSLLSLFFLPSFLFCQQIAGTSEWSGTYSGDINGTPSTMTLRQEGAQVNGSVDAAGYQYRLQGNAQGNTFRGTLSDPQTGGEMDCQGTMTGNAVSLDLSVNDPSSGQLQRLQLQFTRGAAASPGGNAGFGNAQGQAADPAAERDQRLVGAWSYTDSYTSGEYSFATQWRLIINPDGTYIYGDGRVVGGGPGVSGDSGGGGDVTRGQWKTQNKVIYINEGYGWQSYAAYITDGGSLLMTFDDGSKQLWKRTN